ncbi:MAG TPA: NAD-dependent epimerase/dehydratase family protein [Chloroflexi bacterium]|nr:NAD-dependent epimerase/dehydratase family protein [Chloroflexota bacterium]
MADKTTPRILVTGAVGQIGSELTLALRRRYGAERVVAAGHNTPPGAALAESGPFEFLDVTRIETVANVVEKYRIDTIYHMAAVLSAVGESRPNAAWHVNVNGLRNILDIARDYRLSRVFCPSSIAVFGPSAPREATPQDTVLRPTTMYGITKVTGELLCEYYGRRYGVDVRGVRYPGIISSETLPGGGTTDYAVAIYYEAIAHGHYTCFVRADTVLPMMYMPDCIKAAIMLMEADRSRLCRYADYNVAALSFSAKELADEIARHLPGFTCTYAPDARQAIADSWPRSLDDCAARAEWGWAPDYDLETMTTEMLATLRARHDRGALYPKR